MASDRKPETKPLPWYGAGLRFECQACGRCCGGAPGYVWLDEVELVEIARHVGLPPEEFRRSHVKRYWRGMSLREKPNYDCILLDGRGRCVAYKVRPIQCRIWPFWPSNLRNPGEWEEAARRCPGIGQGPVIPFERIEAQRQEMVK
jgi:uncharacterized protein